MNDEDQIDDSDHPDRFITKPGIVLAALALQSWVIHLIYGWMS